MTDCVRFLKFSCFCSRHFIFFTPSKMCKKMPFKLKINKKAAAALWSLVYTLPRDRDLAGEMDHKDWASMFRSSLPCWSLMSCIWGCWVLSLCLLCFQILSLVFVCVHKLKTLLGIGWIGKLSLGSSSRLHIYLMSYGWIRLGKAFPLEQLTGSISFYLLL